MKQRLLNGCRWQAKSFTVAIKQEPKVNLCMSCVNNKYRGGDWDTCVDCTEHINYKPMENAKTAEVK